MGEAMLHWSDSGCLVGEVNNCMMKHSLIFYGLLVLLRKHKILHNVESNDQASSTARPKTRLAVYNLIAMP